MIEVVLPRLGSTTMETAVILRWLKREGEMVSEGETLVEIETDKADVEVPSPATGRLIGIVRPERATVPVGDVIARIEEG